TFVDDPLGVAEDDVIRRETHRLDQFDARNAGRARAIADQLRRLHVATRDRKRIDQTGGRDDGGAGLVVMKDRDVHQFAQALFDDEAFRGLDVFKVDAAERRPQKPDTVDELFSVFRVHFEVDGIDIGEALEQDRLSLHDRL